MTFEEWFARTPATRIDLKAAWDAATAAERERCAKLVENYDARDESGELVRPELGNWTTGSDYGMEAVYTPDEVALAKAIREGKP